MTSVALRRDAFATNEQYLEAASDLAEQKRQALAGLLASEGEAEDKLVFASTLVSAWGVELDDLWARRLAGNEPVNP